MHGGGKNLASFCALAASVIWLSVWACPAGADIATTGSIDPSYDATDPWVIDDLLEIGVTADANVAVSDGSQIVSDRATVAKVIASNATVEVTGSGSRWDNLGLLYIGNAGQGTVTISDGATLKGPDVFLGSDVNSVGNLLLTGAGTTWVGAPDAVVFPMSDPNAGLPADYRISATIGRHGTGNVTIADGARATADDGPVTLGYYEDGVGNLTVTGPSSIWDQTGRLRIGHQGAGTLLISGGGHVASALGTLANSWQVPAGRGSATVTDANSLWRVDGGLYIGGYGHGELLVSNGGRVESEYAHINSTASATESSSVRVTGAGSLWQNERYLIVGHAQRGQLAVQAGGQVTDANAYLGWQTGGEGIAYVGDPDSRWTTGNELHVGYAGTSMMTVEDGGRVTSATGVLGTDATGWGRATISGNGSRWESADSLEIGRAGYGNVAVTGGGRVIAADATLAVEPDSTGVLGVYGTGSAFEVQDDLVLGAQGDASMSVSLGGQVLSQGAVLAQEAGSAALVTVADPNSLWTIADRLDVGGAGDANLVVSNGGRVESGHSHVGGTVSISGPGSTWNSGERLAVADGGDVTVSDGGHVITDMSFIGGDSGSVSSVVVAGAGAQWDSGTSLLAGYPSLIVGYKGDASLLISDGGRVTAPDAWVKAEGDGTALVTVTGRGSRWAIAGRLEVGDAPRFSWVGPQHRLAYGTIIAGDGGVVEAGEIVVYEGSVLTGDGTFQADLVTNHGIIRPGNSIGTLTFDGDLTLDANSVLEVEIDNEGHSDKLIVTGEFTPGFHHVKPIPTEVITGFQQYTVVEANSVAWPAATVVDEYDTAFLESSIGPASGSEPNVVALRVTALAFDDPSVARTSSQRSFGAAVTRLALDPNNALPLLLQQLDTATEARAAYDQLSGRTRAPLGAVTVAAGARPMGIISGRLRGVAGGSSSGSGATASVETGTSRYGFALGNGTPYLSDQRWGVWGKWYGLYGDRETEGAAPGYRYRAYGGGFGLDYRVGEPWLLGVTSGYWAGDVDFAYSADRTDLAGTYVGLYGSCENPAWYVDSVLTYASLDYETTRYADLVSEQLEGHFGGDLLSGYLEAGFNWRRRADCLVQPLASLQVSVLDLDSYTESGGTGSLTFDGERYTSCKGGLGAKATRRLFRHTDGSTAQVELRGRWLREFGDTQSSVGVRFASAPAAAFQITDAPIDRDSVLLGAGFNARVGRTCRLVLDYDTELNADRTVQLFSAALEYRW